jgi:hypothetical protein
MKSHVFLMLPLLMAGAQPALAHHSFGLFDMQKTASVEGTVKDFQWTNPHIWLDLVIPGGTPGQPKVMAIEGDAVGIMQHKGWNRLSLKPGDKVKITFHPLKSGQMGGSLVGGAVNGVEIGNGQTH